MNKGRVIRAGVAATLWIGLSTASWSQPTTPAPAPAAQQTLASGEIAGNVKAGSVPLPGVTVSAANSITGQKIITSTDANGHFALAVPGQGRYVVRAEMTAFAAATKEAVISAESPSAAVDLELQLQSRAQAAPAQRLQQQQLPPRSQGGQRPGVAAAGRGFQNLQVAGNDLNANAPGDGFGGGAAANPGGDTGATESGGAVPQGMENVATESVAVSGRMGNTENMGPNLDDIQDRVQEAIRNGGGNINVNGMGGEMRGGGPGGGMGGFGGGSPMMIQLGGPGGGGGFGGGFGRFNVNKPHGSLFYTVGDPIFDATPYSLTGVPSTKADYMSNRFGGSIGGPMNIPHIYKGGDKTFYFINYTGGRNQNPFDNFYTVPTSAARAGDFTGLVPAGGQLYNPYSGSGAAAQPFLCDASGAPVVPNAQRLQAGGTPCNKIPSQLFNPAAAGLLSYYPAPNEPGTTQNFHYVTTASQDQDNINLRLVHNFGQVQQRQQRGQGGGQGGRGGFGGRGGPGGPGGGRRQVGTRNILNVGFNFNRNNSDNIGSYPSVSGHTSGYGLNVPISYIRTIGRMTTNTSVTFNRSRTQVGSAYSGVKNIEGGLGITGVSQNPLDWGLPGISLTHYSGLNDITPTLNRNQTWSFAEGASYSKGKYNWRFGGDFRRIQLNPRTASNARGQFIFTGFSTAQLTTLPDGSVKAVGGYDFADFLLGFPQSTSAQYGVNNYYFRGNSWDLYVQNDWRVRGNLTLNLGLRYEYVSPLSEKFNHIVNLNPNSTFTAVAPVQPGQSGFPQTLVNPDRNNFAPRVAIAWRATSKTVVRTGYGWNYNTGAYTAIAMGMAYQPPFTFTQTNTTTTANTLTLQNGFPTPTPGTITNNFGVNPNYRMGYVQLANFGVQQEITKTLLLNVDYNWNKGTRLDLRRAPNRTPTGLRIAGVQPFTWLDSLADSTSNSLSVNLRKRMQHGFSIGGTYVYSKSLDDASTIGGTGNNVAQNDQDLSAERGLSSFDIRHRVSVNTTYELPWGTNKRWLATGGGLAKVFGNWNLSQNTQVQSGSPFTAIVGGAITDVARGTNGSLRANVTGQAIQLGDPGRLEWFNTAAFSVPTAGAFGDSRRNSIIGPGLVNTNMSLSKQIPLRDVQGFDIRLDASNVFNHAHFTRIDTNLNSPTYGQIVGVGQMRKMTLTMRYRF